MKQFLSQLSNYLQLLMVPWKRGEEHFFQFWWEYPQIKAQGVHFKPICFGQQLNKTIVHVSNI